jgi:hypothetical protein
MHLFQMLLYPMQKHLKNAYVMNSVIKVPMTNAWYVNSGPSYIVRGEFGT